jgi:hypothetical protein
MAVQGAVLLELRELLDGVTPFVDRFNTHGPALRRASDLLDWDAYAADEDVDGDDGISDDEDEEDAIGANEPR